MSTRTDPYPEKSDRTAHQTTEGENVAIAAHACLSQPREANLQKFRDIRRGQQRIDHVRVGRAIRYTNQALLQWMKSRQRQSTSE
jgi:hypothetical protein